MPPFYTYISSGAPSFVGLLDEYPNAAAAYSLRRLSSSYNGNAIKVRRSSDNTELDIGFVNNELDTTSLLSFVGAGNGFVSVWYDQSGNNNNATQTTVTNQPQVVSVGSVFLENGKPTVLFNGVNNYMLPLSGFGASNDDSFFISAKIVSENDFNFLYDSVSTKRKRAGLWSTNQYFADTTNSLTANPIYSTITSNAGFHVFYFNHSTNNVNISVDNETIQTRAITLSNSSYNLYIGCRNDAADHFLQGTISDFIIYQDNKNTTEQDIKTKILSYY